MPQGLAFCIQCGLHVEREHNPDNSQLSINCIHFHEPHSILSKSCSRYLFEKEMLVIKTREHLAFPEARTKAKLTFNVSSRTCAAAAGNTRHRTADSSPSLHDFSLLVPSSAPVASMLIGVDVTNSDRAPPSNPPATKHDLLRPVSCCQPNTFYQFDSNQACCCCWLAVCDPWTMGVMRWGWRDDVVLSEAHE